MSGPRPAARALPSGAGTFRFTRTGDTSGELTVSYTVSGTATSGTDYTALSGSVTFAAGSATADVAVAAIDDTVYDPDETVVVTVASGTGYTVGTANLASLDIGDSAALTFTLEGTVGGIKYEIPWAAVDPDEAAQSLVLTGFALSLGGYTFTTGTATFTTAPTAQFEYGAFKGITFAIDTSAATGFGYTSIAAGFDINGDNIIAAIQAGTGPHAGKK